MRPDRQGVVAFFGDYEPETILEAYGKGVFPLRGRQPIPWMSPDPRAVLVPRAFRASRSLRKLDRQGTLEVTFDVAFADVVDGCASVPRPGDPGTWIDDTVKGCWETLADVGLAHSVEVWQEGELVGGLYGLALGRAFFGESMFARRRDASKLGLFHLCRRLHRAGFQFVDCQEDTAHLRRLGSVAVPRLRYLVLLDAALSWPNAWK